MAIISICSRRGARLDVLSLTESHWILDREYPFVTVEFLLHPESNLEDVALVLHGQLLEENEYKTLRTRPFYQRLLRYVETGHHHRGDPRVYDFSSSFLNPHLPSNEAYEPPFTSVEPIEGADNYRVYGIEAHHKRCNFGAGNVAGRELAFVNIRPADGRFGGKLTYGFRLGFFLKQAQPESIGSLARFTGHFRPNRYSVYYYTYVRSQSLEKSLQAQMLVPCLTQSRLWLKASRQTGLQDLVEFLAQPPVQQNDALGSLHGKLVIPTSDVFFVVPNHWRLSSRIAGSRLHSLGKMAYMLYWPREPNLPYRAYHLQIAADIDVHKDEIFMVPGEGVREGYDFTVSPFAADLPGAYDSLLRPLPVAALVYAVTRNAWYALMGYLASIGLSRLLRTLQGNNILD